MSTPPLLRVAPWLAIGLVGIISLVPGRWRPHTDLPGPAEHFLAYALAGFVLATQTRSIGGRAVALVFIGVFAGSLEILQKWIPGRDPQFIDFVTSTAGACCGMAVFAMIELLWRRRSGKSA
ncbi:MAG: VanZ family protein [Methylovirgula sp.]